MHQEEIRAAEVEASLVRAGLAEPIDPSSQVEIELFDACDLASAVENAFDERIDPHAPFDRERWLDRLGESYEPLALTSDLHLTRFLWLLDRGERAGTIALPASGLGRTELPIWSLYVNPSHRERGVATRALERAYDAASRVGFDGIQLDTHWVWRRTLRFYLARRMWVVAVTNAIGLAWKRSLPRYEIAEREDEIAIAIEGGEVLWRAVRRRDRVELIANGARPAFALATLGVHLALRGWPFPGGEPSITSLAEKIARFEARARAWGWIVQS
jgi:GNAT superfamily N-acetyltransferase